MSQLTTKEQKFIKRWAKYQRRGCLRSSLINGLIGASTCPFAVVIVGYFYKTNPVPGMIGAFVGGLIGGFFGVYLGWNQNAIKYHELQVKLNHEEFT